MPMFRTTPVAMLAALSPLAAGQIAPVTQERSVMTQVSVSSGASDGDFDEATNFNPFVRSLTSSVTGSAGASSAADASQNSVLSPTLVSGAFSAHSAVATGTTFTTGESDGQSNFLFIFNLAVATPVNFTASGELDFHGANPDGEPSDLYGISRVRLLDASTMDMIAGFQLFSSEAGSDSAAFSGTLPAGDYVILAAAQTHAFSADLLGPPNRSGWGDAQASFSLTVVPAPGAAFLLGSSLLAFSRRRR